MVLRRCIVVRLVDRDFSYLQAVNIILGKGQKVVVLPGLGYIPQGEQTQRSLVNEDVRREIAGMSAARGVFVFKRGS